MPLREGVLDTELCDKVSQWLADGRWFSPGTPVSSTNKTEILLKVTLNTNTPNPLFSPCIYTNIIDKKLLLINLCLFHYYLKSDK
jgi:hypothetical protein